MCENNHPVAEEESVYLIYRKEIHARKRKPRNTERIYKPRLPAKGTQQKMKRTQTRKRYNYHTWTLIAGNRKSIC